MRPRDFFKTNPVFTHAEFLAAHAGSGRSRHTSNSILNDRVASGSLIRVKRGVYATVPDGSNPRTYRPDPHLVASRLSPDAVVAYHSALSFHGYAYSIWTREQFLSSKRLRPFTFRGTEYIAVCPPPSIRDKHDDGYGVKSFPHAKASIRVTTIERTLVDLLHSPDHGGGWEEIWRSLEMVPYLDLDAVIRHTLAMKTAQTVARVGFFLEQHMKSLMVEAHQLESLEACKPRSKSYFDRKRVPGTLARRWNLIVPEDVMRRSWEETLENRS